MAAPTPESMVAGVKATVAQLLCGDTAKMRAAEASLSSMGPVPGFGVALCTVMLDKTQPVAVRQYMGTIMTRIVLKRHWTAESEAQGAGGLVPEADKARIRELLPAALADPSAKIRTQAGLVMAGIGNYDWPNQWPALFTNLLACLRHPNVDLLHGALRCLSFFVPHISTDHAKMATELLSPEVLRVFTDTRYTSRLRARALGVMRECLATLGAMSIQSDAAGLEFVQGLLAAWLPAVGSGLAPAALAHGSDPMQLMALRFMFVVFRHFSDVVAPQAATLVNGVFQFVGGLIPLYHRVAVKGEEMGGGDDDDGYDSDGDVMGLDSVAVESLSVVNALVCVEDDAFSKLVKKNLTNIVEAIISLMHITEAQKDTWESDPNQFVEDDADDFGSASARDIGMDVIGEILGMLGRKGLRGICDAVVAQLKKAGVELAAPACPPATWREQEACLNVMVLAATGIMRDAQKQNAGGAGASGKKSKKAKPLSLNVASVIPYLVACVRSITSPAPPSSSGAPATGAGGGAGAGGGEDEGGLSFVAGRALSVLSAFSRAMPEDQCVSVVAAAVEGLKPGQPVPIRVASCHALRAFCPCASQEALAPLMPEAITRIAHLTASATESLLCFVLNTMKVCLKAAPSVAATSQAVLTPALVRLWMQFITDYQICPAVQEVLSTIAANPQCTGSLVTHLLPTLNNMFAHPDSVPSGALEVALELARAVVEHVQLPMPADVMALFPVTLALVRTTDDESAMQSGADLLAAFVYRSPDQIQAWKDADGASVGLAKLLEVVGRLYGPDVSDSGALYAGRLVTRMLSKFGGAMSVETIGTVLSLALRRLATARTTAFQLSVVALFAHVIVAHGDGVIPMLEAVVLPASAVTVKTKCAALPESVSGLVLLVLVWTGAVGLVEGPFTRKICFVALTKLLAMPRVMAACGNVTVTGDMVPVEGRALRSQTKQYQQLKLPVAMVVAVARGLLAEQEEDEGDWGDDSDSDEEEFLRDMAAAHSELVAMGVLNEGAGAGAGAGAAGASPFASADDTMYIWDGLDDDDNRKRPFADSDSEDADEDDIAMQDHPLFDVELAPTLCDFFQTLGSGAASGGTATALLSGCTAALRPDEREDLASMLAGAGAE